MQSWALRYLIRLSARYAAFGALFYMGLGVLWIDGHVQLGQERDRFMRGALVSGTVVELFPSEQVALVGWKDDGTVYSGRVALHPSDLRGRPGDSIKLRLDVYDPSRAMSAATLAYADRPVTVAGFKVLPTAYFGFVLIALGVLFAPLMRKLEARFARHRCEVTES